LWGSLDVAIKILTKMAEMGGGLAPSEYPIGFLQSKNPSPAIIVVKIFYQKSDLLG
jgi:hypothetical protein